MILFAASLSDLLGLAWLLPLLSFVLIVFFGPRMGKAGINASYVSIGAIVGACLLSIAALVKWVGEEDIYQLSGHQEATVDQNANEHHEVGKPQSSEHVEDHHEAAARCDRGPEYVAGDWYTLCQFGSLKLTIGYYIDSLTICMFCMVTLIASCIQIYAFGYMHEELEDVTDSEVTLSNGQPLKRPGRFHRFFQYLSLFCFSMLGLVIAGNLAMVFVFWELVGICSYFLIGFYIERKSACNAANKAFIVNRIGDFGMIVGLMAIWGSLGTFSFANYPDTDKHGQLIERPGIFTQVRPAGEDYQRFEISEARSPEDDHKLFVPDKMVLVAAAGEIAAGVEPDEEQIQTWRDQKFGYGLLIIGGLGIFCGCVGKSAQFPLHVWLPDAMEGPTPVSALVHSATMVAAGVYLVVRFYPFFTPEVLMVIAVVGAITLFVAATIAVTATDIKRVLAYSTISQLGYMMFALGVGGWLAGILHLMTHAFFKSLLFLCSGSVIHAVHTNDMTEMGGLRKKMPWTATTMLIGCLAISGVGIPLIWFGLSGFYSKDSILAQAILFKDSNPMFDILYFVAVGGATITAFYMFRLWFLTFAGEPRNPHRYEHAHESPKVMYVPLVVLSVFAAVLVWPSFSLSPVVNLLEQSRPAGIEIPSEGQLLQGLKTVDEHDSHGEPYHSTAAWSATATWVLGILFAFMFYGSKQLDPREVSKHFAPIYRFLLGKWWFDELYHLLFVRPVMMISKLIAWIDKNILDNFVDGCARWTCKLSQLDDLIDRLFVDGLVNLVARWTYSIGASLRAVQTGKIRMYVVFIVSGTLVLFILISLYGVL